MSWHFIWVYILIYYTITSFEYEYIADPITNIIYSIFSIDRKIMNIYCNTASFSAHGLCQWIFCCCCCCFFVLPSVDTDTVRRIGNRILYIILSTAFDKQILILYTIRFRFGCQNWMNWRNHFNCFSMTRMRTTFFLDNKQIPQSKRHKNTKQYIIIKNIEPNNKFWQTFNDDLSSACMFTKLKHVIFRSCVDVLFVQHDKWQGKWFYDFHFFWTLNNKWCL